MGWAGSCTISCQVAGGLWKAVTLYATALSLTLGPVSMCARHPGRLLSLPLWFAQWELQLDPSLILHILGPRWVPRCMLLLSLSSPPCSPVSAIHSDRPTLRCLSAWISQACLYVEKGILCWIIVVPVVVTSKGKTWRSSHAAKLLRALGCFKTGYC